MMCRCCAESCHPTRERPTRVPNHTSARDGWLYCRYSVHPCPTNSKGACCRHDRQRLCCQKCLSDRHKPDSRLADHSRRSRDTSGADGDHANRDSPTRGHTRPTKDPSPTSCCNRAASHTSCPSPTNHSSPSSRLCRSRSTRGRNTGRSSPYNKDCSHTHRGVVTRSARCAKCRCRPQSHLHSPGRSNSCRTTCRCIRPDSSCPDGCRRPHRGLHPHGPRPSWFRQTEWGYRSNGLQRAVRPSLCAV